MIQDYEYCMYCGEPTDRAGGFENSLMCTKCGEGPYCDECYRESDGVGPCCNPEYL